MSRPSTEKVGMSKNNAHLNFGFLFGLNNGIIDDPVVESEEIGIIDDPVVESMSHGNR